MIFTAKMLPPMEQAAGIAHVAAGQQMLGGSRVIQHWNLPDEKNLAKAALREGRWQRRSCYCPRYYHYRCCCYCWSRNRSSGRQSRCL